MAIRQVCQVSAHGHALYWPDFSASSLNRFLNQRNLLFSPCLPCQQRYGNAGNRHLISNMPTVSGRPHRAFGSRSCHGDPLRALSIKPWSFRFSKRLLTGISNGGCGGFEGCVDPARHSPTVIGALVRFPTGLQLPPHCFTTPMELLCYWYPYIVVAYQSGTSYLPVPRGGDAIRSGVDRKPDRNKLAE